jgi:predicted NodU family carbamoyl transferase
MNILGISCFYHDAAAALVRDGELIAAAEEERFSRIKHDFGFPSRAIAFCLARGGIAPGELDYVVFYEKPFVKFERILPRDLPPLLALHAYHALLGKPRQFVMEHAAWGESYTPGEIREFLVARGIAHTEARTEDELVDRVAGLLEQGKVVGWFQGRFEWNSLYHRLIRCFGEATGVPVVLNTSFNLKGEPIVASPADALKTFSSSGMDALILGPFLVLKESA